jgi:hypothetical protein
MELTSPSKDTIWRTGLKKEDSTLCCSQQTHPINKNKHWLRVKGWKKIYQDNGP